MYTITAVTETTPGCWEVLLDSNRTIHLKDFNPLLTIHGWVRPDQLRPKLVVTDNWDESLFPIKQAKRLVDVRHWPESELRKYIPSSKSIERLRGGAQHVRWLRPVDGVPFSEGARVVHGGTAIELYWGTSCRVHPVWWGDDDPMFYCPEYKR
jgi:hypothetical protein